MSEGELLQIEKARKLDIDEETYFEVIRQKTASLIATCCEAGAVSGGRDDEAERMRLFGEKVGLAFQIKDDSFYYVTLRKIGKLTGNDIREQKMILPLIYTLNTEDKKTRNELINIVKRHNENPKKVRRAIQLVVENGGIDHAYEVMTKIKNEALELLEPIPNSESKEALIKLVEYTVNREK